MDEDSVFLHSPGSSDTVADVVELKPPCVALDLGFSGHQFTNPVPRVITELVHPHHQLFILPTVTSY